MMWQSSLGGHNRHINRDGNSLYEKSFIDKGILTIRDILMRSQSCLAHQN